MLANLTQKTVAKDILLKKIHFLVNKGYKKTVMRKTNKRNNKAGTYTFDIKKKASLYIYIWSHYHSPRFHVTSFTITSF